jgi:hypothetical protein
MGPFTPGAHTRYRLVLGRFSYSVVQLTQRILWATLRSLGCLRLALNQIPAATGKPHSFYMIYAMTLRNLSGEYIASRTEAYRTVLFGPRASSGVLLAAKSIKWFFWYKLLGIRYDPSFLSDTDHHTAWQSRVRLWPPSCLRCTA